MKVIFDINTKNDAFAKWGMIEVQRIIEDAVKVIDIVSDKVHLHDTNGNSVGTMTVKFERGESL